VTGPTLDPALAAEPLILADHPLLFAVPVLIPAVVVVVLVAAVVIRDRRQGLPDDDPAAPETPARAGRAPGQVEPDLGDRPGADGAR
jgi:hypothetical protein